MKEHLIVRELLTLAAADMLDPAEEARVQNHLRSCAECRAEQNEWGLIMGALQSVPIPQASPRLVLQTQRLLSHSISAKKNQASRLGLALLVVFSWMVTFMTVRFVRMFDIPLARWLDVPSSAVWFAYNGMTWLATALAAGLLAKHWQQEGRTV